MKMNNELQDAIRKEVRICSQNWIESFNRGDVDACVAAYKPDAIMHAKPMGTFTGQNAIDGFWRPFMASGAGQLEYHDVKLEVVNESAVLLSANWRMNVGRGVITMEIWVKQPDGNWVLEQDDFEVLEQFER